MSRKVKFSNNWKDVNNSTSPRVFRSRLISLDGAFTAGRRWGSPDRVAWQPATPVFPTVSSGHPFVDDAESHLLVALGATLFSWRLSFRESVGKPDKGTAPGDLSFTEKTP